MINNKKNTSSLFQKFSDSENIQLKQKLKKLHIQNFKNKMKDLNNMLYNEIPSIFELLKEFNYERIVFHELASGIYRKGLASNSEIIINLDKDLYLKTNGVGALKYLIEILMNLEKRIAEIRNELKAFQFL